LNDQKLVCELSIQARHARRQELVVEAVSDFGARLDFEFMTLKHQSTKLFKCGDEQTSSIRCAIRLDQHRSQLKQLIDLFERSSNMLISDRPDAVFTIKKSISGESLLQFKLSSVMIRSIDAEGASTADQSASYVVELQPRSIRSMVSGTLSEYAESDLPWENFSLEQVEEPAKSLDSSMNMSKQRLLRLSPNFPANSGGIALHPLVFAKVGESSSEIDSTTKKRILGFHQQLGVNEVFDRPQSRRLKVEFYLFPNLLSPLVSSSELSFTAMLDSLVLFLVYGRDSMIAGSGISVAPLDPSQYTAGMISGSYRSFLVYDVEPFRNFAMNVEDASYLVDRFDRRGRPSRARFQIEGLLFNSLS
jgi:hypothetical protein